MFESRPLFPFDCVLKVVVSTDSLSEIASVSWRPGRLDTWSAICFQRLRGQNVEGTLLAAVCLLLLDAPGCDKPLGHGGDHGRVVLALEIVVAVWEMDRRVHFVHVVEEVGELGLITCVWGWVGHSARPTPRLGFCSNLLPWMTRTLKGRGGGEDKTRGNGQWGMLSNDIKERDGGELQRRRGHSSPWTLEPCRWVECDTRTRKMCVCARRVRCTVYTHRRVQGSCHCLDAKSRKETTTNQQLCLLSCWSLQHNKMWRRRSGDDVDNFRLGVRNCASSFLVSGSTSWDLSRCCFILPLFRPRIVFPFVLMPVRSPGGGGPPGWTWCPGRRGCRLGSFFCKVLSPTSA